MAKRKKPSSEQSELPLDIAPAKPPNPGGTAESPASVSPGGNGGQTHDEPQGATAPPKRKEGEKVQDEQAPLAQSYRNWFLDYASYVILDRAIPHIDDGLKPVQRRVLHTLWDMDDGRFHKVANVVGATMKLHPHGDASIGAALVSIGQRGWLIEPQGNYGNLLTGDDAAAPRYIEARLTAFAKDVLFNPKTTTWQLSYDGRNKEPVTLPAKFPIVLLEGADGIAVGLSTKILPHNFNDLCRNAGERRPPVFKRERIQGEAVASLTGHLVTVRPLEVRVLTGTADRSKSISRTRAPLRPSRNTRSDLGMSFSFALTSK